MDQLRQGDALLLVDVQNDFIPGGALPVPDGAAVVPVLNAWIAAAEAAGAPVFASRDWHPAGHVSFQPQGGPWPPHCVQDTPGAAFHSDLQLPEDATVISKAMKQETDAYSAFDGTDLADHLRAQEISRVWVAGLALDVCVRATALDASSAGFDTIVVLPGCRAITPEGERETLEALQQEGVGLYRDEAPPAGG